jgi:hypothetical protein
VKNTPAFQKCGKKKKNLIEKSKKKPPEKTVQILLKN